MTFDPETATFLIAGPVRIHPRVLRAMSTPSLNHRGDYFHSIVEEIRAMLPVLFGTPGHQVVLSGSGTAGLEADVLRARTYHGPYARSHQRQFWGTHGSDRSPILATGHDALGAVGDAYPGRSSDRRARKGRRPCDLRCSERDERWTVERPRVDRTGWSGSRGRFFS